MHPHLIQALANDRIEEIHMSVAGGRLSRHAAHSATHHRSGARRTGRRGLQTIVLALVATGALTFGATALAMVRTDGLHSHASIAGVRRHVSIAGVRRHVSIAGVRRHVSIAGVRRHVSIAGVRRHVSIAGVRRHVSIAGVRRHVSIAGVRKHMSIAGVRKHVRVDGLRRMRRQASAVTLRRGNGLGRHVRLRRALHR